MSNKMENAVFIEPPFPWEDHPHVAFAGRSNVGKSSLLNALLKRKVARTSSTPGRTRNIYCYLHEPLVYGDLPGFGYARVSHAMRKQWDGWLSRYFSDPTPVRTIVLCMDPRLAEQDADIMFLDWIRPTGLPIWMIGTRCDRFNQKERAAATKRIQSYRQQYPDVITYSQLTSARKGTGLPQLLAKLASLADSFGEDT